MQLTLIQTTAHVITADYERRYILNVFSACASGLEFLTESASLGAMHYLTCLQRAMGSASAAIVTMRIQSNERGNVHRILGSALGKPRRVEDAQWDDPNVCA
jgi:hypothetical protein